MKALRHTVGVIHRLVLTVVLATALIGCGTQDDSESAPPVEAAAPEVVDSTPTREPSALEGVRDMLQTAGVACTDWVEWDRSGSMRVIDSVESGSCRDQEIIISIHDDLDAAVQKRTDNGLSQFVWGGNWIVKFDDPNDFDKFSASVGASAQ